ncbi:MAG: APC family permease [Actinomycetota bacterium]|nr:APC family permease [Actinomycetota bacterium]
MEAASFATPVAQVTKEAPQPGLKRGAISYISNVVIGVASTAPGYSLAATIGFIVGIAGMGAHMPAVIIVSFLPMFGIAMAYKAMNKADPDCGTTFSWMSRAMGAGWGFLGGWAIIYADIVVNANQAQIAGSYGLQLFGIHNASQLDITIVGVVFIVVLTWICWKGIELSARTQQLLLSFEITTLFIFAVVALIKVYVDHPKNSITVQPDWFNPLSVGFGALFAGMLLGVFLYWGWDSGVSVNEETKDSDTAPGKAALVSNLVLIVTFLLVAVAAQAYGGLAFLGDPKNAADIFSAGLSTAVLGSLHVLLIIAVLTSATAATQTTILPAARQALSMSRRGAIPKRFSEIHPTNRVPAFATIVAGVLSVIWFVFIVQVSTNVLADSISGLGLLVCFYYGFTGLACIIFYRREITKSTRNFFQYFAAPAFGAIVLAAIFVKGFVYYGHAANTTTGKAGPLGLGTPDWIAILGFVLGIGLMLVSRWKKPDFYRNEKRLVYGDHFEPVTPEAEFAPAESML